jgi:TolB-like protein
LSFIKELKRRNVFKVGIAYAVTTWILLQLTDVVTDILHLPDWAPQLILLILLVGFIPALILAWAFELTPDGVKLETEVTRKDSIAPKTGRILDYIIIISLGLSLGYFIWESRFEQKTEEYEAAVAEALVAEPVIEEPQAQPPEPFVEADANSIAVLPFANRSADAEDIYFTDGIHDDLLTQLSKIEAFSVISRTSMMEYRDTTKNLRQIARELSVANIMEGSVQRAGDRVRINVQLIDAESDEHLWAEIYDRELTTNNLFDIQSEIAQAIALELEATLTDSELASVADVPTESVEAYDMYLQARRINNDNTRRSNQVSAELLIEALKLDPLFKLGWVELANVHMTNYWSFGGDTANRDLALEAIEKARIIDAGFAELYMAEGFYWYWGHLDYERALYYMDKAIEMMPGNEEIHMWRGFASRRSGLWEQALESMEHSLKLNPRDNYNWYEYAFTAQIMHRLDEARVGANQSRKLDSDSLWGKTALAALVVHESGDTATAMQLTIGAQHADEFEFLTIFMSARILAHRFDEALSAARELRDEVEIRRQVVTLREDWAAQILYFSGRQEEAVQAANAAIFRLKSLRAEMGEDYRLNLAEARVTAIRGAETNVVNELVQKSILSNPKDAVLEIRFNIEYAHIYAIAGMLPETIEILEQVLAPPGEYSVFMVDLDPAFDKIRNEPEFVAMLEQYR